MPQDQSWLTSQLKRRVRDIYEPKYGRTLSDDEVHDIAENLTGYLEALLKFKWKNQYGKYLSD